MRLTLALFLLFTFGLSFGQVKGISSEIQLSYSGYNHNIMADFSRDKWCLSLGINTNYSKHANLNLSAIGGVAEFGYAVLDSTLQLMPVIRAQFIPGKSSTIFETYIGHRVGYSWKPRWRFYNVLGIGGYQESSKEYNYTLNGFSYCATFGLQYRF